jgi:membrane protein
MARLHDVPHVVRTIGWWGLLKRVYQQVNEDQLFTWAAALAYAWMFAIFPFFIFLLTLAPYLPYDTRETAQREINDYIDKTLPFQAAQTLKENVQKVMSEPKGGLLSIGLLLTIWAASGGMAMTMRALDIAYDVDRGRKFIHQRLVAIGLTIVVATLILIVMLLLPIGTMVINWLAANGLILGGTKMALNIARYGFALLLLLGVLSIIYHWGPSIRTRYRVFSPGTVFAIAVWLILGFAFRQYINHFGKYDKTYGTVGGVAILLLFFYIDALVLLIGAEINSEIDFVTLGIPSASGDSPAAAAMTAAGRDEEKQQLARELSEKRSGAPVSRPLGPPVTGG